MVLKIITCTTGYCRLLELIHVTMGYYKLLQVTNFNTFTIVTAVNTTVVSVNIVTRDSRRLRI